jgi:hypothetical protein
MTLTLYFEHVPEPRAGTGPDDRPLRRPVPLQVDRPLHRDPGHIDGLHQSVHRADLSARHLPRHQPQSPDPRQYRLHALDVDGLHGGVGRPPGHVGPGRRHVRARARLQPRLRRLHLFSILLSVTWLTGSSGAWWLITMRVGQGVGGAMLFANSSAIVTDAFPTHQRGLGSASTTSPPSPVRSSGSYWAGSWLRSSGTSSSCSLFRSGCSAPFGPT